MSSAMILAAGRGERLRPQTDTCPKALLDVGGEPLIDKHLRRLARANVTRVVVNVDWLGEQIIDHVGDGSRFGVDVTFSPEFGQVQETAGGIRKAIPMLGDDPFWVINADVLTDIELPSLSMPDDVLGHLFLIPTPSFKANGDFDLTGGKIANGKTPAYTFAGVANYKPAFFDALEPGYAPLAPLLREAADRGELQGTLFTGVWEDVGTPERLQSVRQRFR